MELTMCVCIDWIEVFVVGFNDEDEDEDENKMERGSREKETKLGASIMAK